MKTALLFILLLLANTFVHSQIDVNSTRTNSLGDLQLRRHSAGDTAWKRALVTGYNPSNANGKLYLNYAGDFKDGVKINGSIVSIDGKVGIGTDNPSHELVVRGTSSPNIELKNSNYSTGGFILNRTNYGQQWKWWAQSNIMYFGFATDESNYSNKFTIKSNGNVGIGTTNPDQKLTVQGNVNIGGTGNAILRVRHIEGKHYQNANYDNLFLNYASGKNVYVGNPYNHNLSSNLYVTGNVGIGTTSPAEKLSVNGNIRAKEVKVELENWPDYVFKADYKLPSLTSVKAFISKNGHLPDIPDATEVHQNGVALGDISGKLLQKIEELTLYTLQQEAKLQKQQQLIDALSARLSQIAPQTNNYEPPTP